MEDNKKIIVSIEPVLRFKKYLETVFANTEFELLTVSNGREAQGILTNISPALILMETNLPEMDGPATLATIREIGCTCPVIIISGHKTPDLVYKMSTLGASDFLSKPCEAETILARVRAVLSDEPTTLLDSLEVVAKPVVLVVDDVGYSRTLINRMLIKAGYKVEEATTGPEALQQAKKTNPDLLILDINLPGFSGVQVMHKLREENFNIPVIVVSAFENPEVIVELKSMGIIDLFSKPVNLSELEKRIKEILGGDENDPQGSFKTMKSILIAEENVQARSLIEKALRQDGYKITTATDGFKAKSEISFGNPDLVIMDLNLQGIDGIAILRELAEKEDPPKIITMAAFGDEQVEKECLDLGSLAFFPKPLNLGSLRQKIKEIFE